MRVKKLLLILATLCIVTALSVNVGMYFLYGKFPDFTSEVMPKETKVVEVNISQCGSFVDENNVLWVTGRQYKDKNSLGLGYTKGKSSAVKAADNVLTASDGFYITLDNKLYGWNNVPYIAGVSDNGFEKEPVYIMDNVAAAQRLSEALVINKTDGSLVLAGTDTFVTGAEYTAADPMHLMENVKSFWCVENYMDKDSLYVIDNNDILYVMGGNRNGQLGLGNFDEVTELSVLDNNVRKVGGVSRQMYYLKNNGELYAWGHYGGSNMPVLYLNEISDFSGGSILFCITSDNSVCKYRNDKLIGQIEDINVSKISSSSIGGTAAILTDDGKVLLSSDDNSGQIIPTYKSCVDFENPIVLQNP